MTGHSGRKKMPSVLAAKAASNLDTPGWTEKFGMEPRVPRTIFSGIRAITITATKKTFDTAKELGHRLSIFHRVVAHRAEEGVFDGQELEHYLALSFDRSEREISNHSSPSGSWTLPLAP